MSLLEYCPAEVGTYKNQNCPPAKDGIVAVHYIHESAYPFADWTDSTEWDAKQTAGTVKSIYKTRGTYTGPQWNEGDGFGFNSTTKTGAEHAVEYQHRGVDAVDGTGAFVNQEFYNDLAQNEGDYYIAWVAGSKVMKYSDATVDVQPGDPQDTDVKGEQVYNVISKFDQFGMVSKTAVPAVAYTLY